MAAAVGVMAGSPIPLTPSGVLGSGSVISTEVMVGTSSAVGNMYLAKPGVVVLPSIWM